MDHHHHGSLTGQLHLAASFIGNAERERTNQPVDGACAYVGRCGCEARLCSIPPRQLRLCPAVSTCGHAGRCCCPVPAGGPVGRWPQPAPRTEGAILPRG